MKLIKYIGEYEMLDENFLINIRGNIVNIFIWRSFLKVKRKYTWFNCRILKLFTY